MILVQTAVIRLIVQWKILIPNNTSMGLTVYCPHNVQYCNWQGIAILKKHLDEECLYGRIICPKYGCMEEMTRNHLPDHMTKECGSHRVHCPCCGLDKVQSFGCDKEHIDAAPLYYLYYLQEYNITHVLLTYKHLVDRHYKVYPCRLVHEVP